jgi:hypothetical protein
MMKIEATSALFLILGWGGGMTNRTPRLSVASPKMSDTPALINTCLITNDVNQLAAFYAQVLQIEPHTVGEDYVEFRTKHRSTRFVRRHCAGEIHPWLRKLGPEPQRDSGV